MLHWPSRELIKVYVAQTLMLVILFTIIYGTTNFWAQSAPHIYHFWIPRELAIPFIPAFIFVYFSLNLLTLMPLFVLDVRQMRALGATFGSAILLAGFVFYFFPAPIGWPRPELVAGYEFYFRTLYVLDKSANTFPSLHITFGFLCVRVLARVHQRLRLLWFWFGLIALSVLFTHQHHLFDIAGGIVLGEFCASWVYPRLVVLPSAGASNGILAAFTTRRGNPKAKREDSYRLDR